MAMLVHVMHHSHDVPWQYCLPAVICRGVQGPWRLCLHWDAGAPGPIATGPACPGAACQHELVNKQLMMCWIHLWMSCTCPEIQSEHHILYC